MKSFVKLPLENFVNWMIGEQLGGVGEPPKTKKKGLDYYDWELITSFQAKCQKSPLGLCVCVFFFIRDRNLALDSRKKHPKENGLINSPNNLSFFYYFYINY